MYLRMLLPEQLLSQIQRLPKYRLGPGVIGAVVVQISQPGHGVGVFGIAVAQQPFSGRQTTFGQRNRLLELVLGLQFRYLLQQVVCIGKFTPLGRSQPGKGAGYARRAPAR